MEDTITTYHTGRIQWGAITAGTIFALALSLVLLQFGAVIGLSATEPYSVEPEVATWGVVVSGLWILWVQVISSLSGGYIAGRFRQVAPLHTPHESEMRDGLAGLLSWASATVLVMIGLGVSSAFAGIADAMINGPVSDDILTEGERNTAIIFAFITGATSIVSAAAAWWAGTVGGDHRDQGTDFSTHFSFRTIKK